MAVLGVSSVAPAFPAIARVFGVGASQIGLLITAFTLPGVLLSPVLGAWADRWGRRAVLVPSLVLFALSGVACAFAPGLHVLVALRFLQGVGAASLGSLNVTLIGDLFQGRRQVAAMGANSAVLSVGTASYPLIGGALADLDWRLPFFLPVLALPIAWAAARTLGDSQPRRPRPLREYLAQVAGQLDRQRLGLMLASLLTFVILYGSYLTYLPFVMDERFGASPTTIGSIFFAASVATGIVSLRLAAITQRIGRERALLASYVAYAVSMALVPHMPSAEWMILPSVLFGIGNGMNIPTLMSWIAASVEREVRAGVMALNAVALRGGQTAGPLVAALGFSLGGIEGAFLVGTAVSVILFALAIALARGTEAHGEGAGPQDPPLTG